jgi:hypothetical protein
MSSSINSVSTSSISQSSSTSGSQRRQGVGALAQALQSGDLAGAQKAFSALSQKFPAASPSAADGSTSTDARANDLSQLSKALQSGDLAGAQKAFASLKQDAQSVGAAQSAGATQQSGQVHQHHGHHRAAPTVASTGTSNQNVGPLGNNVDVTA